MSTIARFLESLSTTVNAPDDAQYTASVEAIAHLDEASRSALLARDPVALARAVGKPVNFACMIMVPDNDEPARETPDDDDGCEEPTDAPSKAA